MIYVVLFEDDNARAEMRSQFMEQHLSFLARNAPAIQAAGPLANADDRAPAGGLWLVNADSLDVRALYEQDPFWPTGLRKSVRVLEWKRVFADGRKLV